jgi:Tfp pilus assembly protein PilX
MMSDPSIPTTRPTPFQDERGAALIAVMLFVVVLGGLSLVLLASLLGQIRPSFSAQQNTQTGYAAQAGLQAGLGALRSAQAPPNSEGVVYGDPTRLPCTFTGPIDNLPNSVSYEVRILYFTQDPTNQSDLWRETNKLTCQTTGGVTVPRFNAIRAAVVQSTAVSLNTANGIIQPLQRSISAIYQFQVTNRNIPGGRIYDEGFQYCMRAISATSGSLITYDAAANCSDTNPLQLWIYDTDYRIKLASSTQGSAVPLCMTGAGGETMRLDPCLATTDPARWNQLWSFTNSWFGQRNPINLGQSNVCISSGFANGTDLRGRNVLARVGCVGSSRAEAKVGAGASGKATNQIVSYAEFGRCTDVTSEVITSSYMIVYPCKQDAAGAGSFLWNHKFFYDEPTAPATSVATEIFVRLNDSTTAANRYCMQTPVSTSSSRYVTFVVCNNDSRQRWQRVANSGLYETSYLFVDTYGRCLTTDNTDLHGSQYSKMTVVGCSGSLIQKWNAPPSSNSAVFGGYREYGS